MIQISNEQYFIFFAIGLLLSFIALIIFQAFQALKLKNANNELVHILERRLTENQLQQTQDSSKIQSGLQETLSQLNENVLGKVKDLSLLLETRLNEGFEKTGNTLAIHNENMLSKVKDLSFLLEKRLHEGFEKTATTFTDIVKRLALIDDAQKKLTELSSNVVSLQEILVDKRSRGAFGEIQLKNLVQNVLPESNFAFQHTLTNAARADCILFLPEPTGNMVIDSKFPLENFQLMTDFNISEPERKKAQQQFKQDIKKHIQDIASKYIIPNETSDGAIMFVPAEAVFAEIHAHFPDLVELAHRSFVWLASPTTLMAILTTARAVLKDQATKEHLHIIQEHLRYLAEDFQRFDLRMQNLAKHIDQANKDVQQVQTSAKKISQRFIQIEKAELGQSPSTLMLDDFKETQEIN